MESFKFWLNLALVIASSYVMVWYIFKPSDNQCQMTFMMEPPKFVPVLFDETDNHIGQKKQNNKIKYQTEDYRLYMYSEFGFPLASDLRRDLRDSVPVLFVPGNAGSYQQVRSIASTCIRFQLHSLDAAKFIFYTIDFGGQLSGISGSLIEQQIRFVQKSIDKILSIYPEGTDRLILIGHSVGGFISKALFTMPNFEPKSVPLLISLASPLTNSYLNFDSEMRQLYHKTNEFWSSIDRSKTLSISINGGRSDYLVPMHLSMDVSYDISLTTNSIKDVWLATEHVSITWCRELVHKLSKLLSLLIDKKTSKLIDNKQTALAIIKSEIFSEYKTEEIRGSDIEAHRSWKVTRPHVIMDLNEKFYKIMRSQLSDKVMFIKTNQDSSVQEYLIYILHIGPLKEARIYGCESIDSGKVDQISCNSKTNLMTRIKSIPSRRFEPKTSIITLTPNQNFPVNYIVLDYSNIEYRQSNQMTDVDTIPESISVQQVDSSIQHSLYIPSVIEFIIKKFIVSFKEKVKVDKNVALVHSRYQLSNLKQNTQVFSIKFESTRCKYQENPSETKILLFQGTRLSESFHLPINQNSTNVDIKISPNPAIIIRDELNDQAQEFFLEFYIDGTCDNYIKIELDLLDLIVNVIQRNLDKILAYITYLAYALVIINLRNFNLQEDHASPANRGLGTVKIVGFLSVYLIIGDLPYSEEYSIDLIANEITEFVVVSFLSFGSIAVLKCLTERVLDLAIIVKRLQDIILKKGFKRVEKQTNGTNHNGTSISKTPKTTTETRMIDWFFIGFIIVTSFMFSNLVYYLAQLYFLMKLELEVQSSPTENETLEGMNQSRFYKHVQKFHALITSLGSFVGLAIISNTPAALLITRRRILNPGVILDDVSKLDQNLLISSMCLLLLKLISDNLSYYLRSFVDNHGDRNHSFKTQANTLLRHMHLIALGPILLVNGDIRYINLALLVSLMQVIASLPKTCPPPKCA